MSREPESESTRLVPGPGQARGRPRYLAEASPRRLRMMLGGDFVADSTRRRHLALRPKTLGSCVSTY